MQRAEAFFYTIEKHEHQCQIFIVWE